MGTIFQLRLRDPPRRTNWKQSRLHRPRCDYCRIRMPFKPVIGDELAEMIKERNNEFNEGSNEQAEAGRIRGCVRGGEGCV